MKPVCAGCGTGIDGEPERVQYETSTWNEQPRGFVATVRTACLHPADPNCKRLFEEQRKQMTQIPGTP